MKGVQLTPLKKIELAKGNVLHGLKASEDSYHGFGEAYFSFVHHKTIKGWKRHNQMYLNLIVPHGNIRFVVYDDRTGSETQNSFFEIILGVDHPHARITIAPGLWVAFQGLSSDNLLLNIANMEHNPEEADSKDIDTIKYDW